MVTADPEIYSRVLKNSDQYLLMGNKGLLKGIDSREDLLKTIDSKMGEVNPKNLKILEILGEMFEEVIAVDPDEEEGRENMAGILVKFNNIAKVNKKAEFTTPVKNILEPIVRDNY